MFLSSIFYFKKFIPKLILTGLIILNIFIFSSLDDEELLPENVLSVVRMDIGQGDSFLIKFPNSKTALIDAGNTNFYFDNGERVSVSYWGSWLTCPDFDITDEEILDTIELKGIDLLE